MRRALRRRYRVIVSSLDAARIALDGELPLNTNGGQAGERQVKKDVKVTVVVNGCGSLGGAIPLRQDP